MLSVIVMLLLISLLILVHELGHFWVAKRCGVKVERFGMGLPFGPTLWKKQVGDTEYCLHPLLFGGYVSFPDDNADSPVPPDSPRRFENQPLLNRAAIALAGVTVNAITGWALMLVVILGWGLPTLDVTVQSLTSSHAPAALAGFHSGEVIRKINGQPVQGDFGEERIRYVASTIRKFPKTPVTLELQEKNGEIITRTVEPNEAGLIGIRLGGKEKYLHTPNPLRAAWLSSRFLANVVQMQFVALGRLVTGQIAPKELSGPIGIVSMGAKLIDEGGIQQGLMLTAVVSVLLAVMNLLPIPALDGGHLIFIAIEAVFRRPVRREWQERIIQAGFLSLLVLMGFVLWNDIQNTWLHPAKGANQAKDSD